MRFAHIADVHAGHRQYNKPQREKDMVASFNHALKTVTMDGSPDTTPADTGAGVDAILIPGDLFHSRDLRPRVLATVEDVLQRVPDDVPVAVSRGNHDENLTPRDHTWLEYLHERDLLTFLCADLGAIDPDVDPSDPPSAATSVFEPAARDAEGAIPGFLDLPGPTPESPPVRVFGLQYRGGYIDGALTQAAAGIRAVNDAYGQPSATVLLAHFGLREEVPDLGARVSDPALQPLKDVVDYLALGHIHKRYERDWVYNPGSPEAHDTQEARWTGKHGFYVADVSDEGIATTHYRSKRRPFYQLEFDVSDYGTSRELEAGFETALEEATSDVAATCSDPYFQSGGERRQPVIDLRFIGTLKLERSAFDIDALRDQAEEVLDALHVQVTNATQTADIQALLDGVDAEDVFTEDGTLDTDVVEAQVFEQIVQESGYDSHTADVAGVLSEVRAGVTDDRPMEDLADLVQETRRNLFPAGPSAEAATPDETDDTDHANEGDPDDGRGGTTSDGMVDETAPSSDPAPPSEGNDGDSRTQAALTDLSTQDGDEA